ncbi:MAG: HD domain-containing protein [Methylacidiphilales bacterium]|nr:HD domain-containing protein [Candidatus Methylacidiphilales bacterium]
MSPFIEESLGLRARYDEEPSHSDHVADLALQIFDGLRPWHDLRDHPRELLHGAALLHDIGWAKTPDGKGHHKWSAKLIREHPWKHLSADEVPVMAQIARYHRKTSPQPDHAEFHALSAPAQRLVMILGGILRIADALDRTHTGKVERADTSATEAKIVVRVKITGPWNAEREMFAAKRDMLQIIAERPVEVEGAR